MNDAPRVLVVDDDRAVRYTLRAILEEDELAVVEASDGAEALVAVDAGGVDLVISDLLMPRLDGMQLLRELAGRPGAPRVILVTAHGSERAAVDAMKLGALDYFPKPFDPAEVLRVVRRALRSWRLERDNERLQAELALSRRMVFRSPAMRRIAEVVQRVAGRDVTVLIRGESGTGKELVARAIVDASPRCGRPYVRFNCAALPRELADAELFGHSQGAFTGATRARRGLFREADGGTILLDEIGELDPQTQGALLRVLQEREVRPVGEDRPVAVDVRVLAATNRDLSSEVSAGRFRKDLYYRLDVVHVVLPPLRERPDDILPLAEMFAERVGERFGLGPARFTERARLQLEAAPWPGNVRELEHAIERTLALAAEPVLDDVLIDHGGAPPSSVSLKQRLAAFERGIIAAELGRCHGNQSEVARRLGVGRVTLIDKLKRYGLRPEDPKG
jgi:two-component system, NtrC family, response regulator HydG